MKSTFSEWRYFWQQNLTRSSNSLNKQRFLFTFPRNARLAIALDLQVPRELPFGITSERYDRVRKKRELIANPVTSGEKGKRETECKTRRGRKKRLNGRANGVAVKKKKKKKRREKWKEKEEKVHHQITHYRVGTCRGNNYAVCNATASPWPWKKVISATVGIACPPCVVSTCRC